MRYIVLVFRNFIHYKVLKRDHKIFVWFVLWVLLLISHAQSQVNVNNVYDQVVTALQKEIRDELRSENIKLNLWKLNESQIKGWKHREDLELKDKIDSVYNAFSTAEETIWFTQLGTGYGLGFVGAAFTGIRSYLLIMREKENEGYPVGQLLQKIKAMDIQLELNAATIKKERRRPSREERELEIQHRRLKAYIMNNYPREALFLDYSSEVVESVSKGYLEHLVFQEGRVFWKQEGQENLRVVNDSELQKLIKKVAAQQYEESVIANKVSSVSMNKLPMLREGFFNGPDGNLFSDIQINPKTNECFVLLNKKALWHTPLWPKEIQILRLGKPEKTYFRLMDILVALDRFAPPESYSKWEQFLIEVKVFFPRITNPSESIAEPHSLKYLQSTRKGIRRKNIMKVFSMVQREMNGFVNNHPLIEYDGKTAKLFEELANIQSRYPLLETNNKKITSRKWKLVKSTLKGFVSFEIVGTAIYFGVDAYFNKHSTDRLIEILKDPQLFEYHPFTSDVRELAQDFVAPMVQRARETCQDPKTGSIDPNVPCKVEDYILDDMLTFVALLRKKHEIPLHSPFSIGPSRRP